MSESGQKAIAATKSRASERDAYHKQVVVEILEARRQAALRRSGQP
jgi:hypothetical protein